ncbi:MAG TPA: ribbon-helix-helix domain-containing protein [Solirubrobacterales bacterium]|jgi:Arc/MetJ-type ribon-helix-helix transcriptional regulator|nr:ribbon-helix-helix domain-containing protein [Solirubrobacterales bacterium]
MEQLLAPVPQRYADCMTQQIATRIPNDQLEALDSAVKAGNFESRADGVRQALTRLLGELREQEIAEEYREAYTRHPQDAAIGKAGAKLLAEAFKREEGRSS